MSAKTTKLHNTATKHEKAVLVAVETQGSKNNTDELLSELEQLVNTAGASVQKWFTQKLQQPDSRTYVGSGKFNEIATYVKQHEIDMVVFDDELSPSQLRNLEKELENVNSLPAHILSWIFFLKMHAVRKQKRR